ncbi:ras-related protein Rab-10-like [Crassostrea virginica]|uniref:Ras-related protein Rab-10-like n=1 Tax=Crassostrea virginica TaxID=6565 RepID=A0A8B8E6D2_CRAVI|nr:ras-related protein Rab-10-like [Crassostrea virginica]
MENNLTSEKTSPLQRTMSKRYDVLLRLLLIGETGVGKTCVLCRYASEEFIDSHITTIGIDFKMKTISLGGKTIKVQIWDTAGQERFESITKQFYRRAQGVILVYDITSKNSFEAVPKWLSYVRQFGREDVSVLLMGNKKDKAENRQVLEEEGKKFAKENNLLFYETSAKDSANLEKAFYSLCEDVIHKEKEKDKSSVENNNHLGQTEEVGQKDTTQLITDNKEKKFTCCNVS